ncbi:MAG: hypothetical protein ABIN74_03040 [Ferruginibacter sp.]
MQSQIVFLILSEHFCHRGTEAQKNTGSLLCFRGKSLFAGGKFYVVLLLKERSAQKFFIPSDLFLPRKHRKYRYSSVFLCLCGSSLLPEAKYSSKSKFYKKYQVLGIVNDPFLKQIYGAKTVAMEKYTALFLKVK